MRHSRTMVWALVMAVNPMLSACAPSIGGALSTIETVRGLRQASEFNDRFWEARKRQIPVAGTYRLTYAFPGEAPMALYVRTLSNANIPLAIDQNRYEIGSGGYDLKNVDLGTAYLVNVVGAGTVETIPDSMHHTSAATAAGFLIVTDTVGRDAQGRQRLVGSFQVRADTTAPGDVGKIARNTDRLIRDIEAAERLAEKQWNKASRKERKNIQHPVRERYTIFSLDEKGGVATTEQILTLNGQERMRIRAERVSTHAYVVPPENLEKPSMGDIFRGYRGALTGGN